MAVNPKRPQEKAAPKKKKKKVLDSARLAKLVIQRRTLALMLVFGVLSFLALFAQAYDLTINQNKALQDLASSQQMSSTVLTASRGSILDRTGVTLAVSATADTVFLDPNAIDKYVEKLEKARAQKLVDGLKEGEKMPLSGQEYKDLLAKNLAAILEIEEQTVYDEMAKTNYRYAVLKRRVDRTVGDQIRAFITDNETGSALQGVHLESDSKRYYPRAGLASHVVGFLNNDNHGAWGLEAIYEDTLEGTSGLTVTAKDGSTNSEIMFQYEQYYDAEEGHTIQTTIDSNIQYYLERGLADMVSKYGAKNGAAGVILNPQNGAILAIASNPTYDSNAARSIYDEKLQAELAQVDEENPPEEGDEHAQAYWDKLQELQNKQWWNKAVNETYEPGSTFKILTLSMALEEGSVTPASTFQCNGMLRVNTDDIYCSNHAGHGHQTLKEAVGNSCNPAFINIGFSVGSNRFYDYLEAFGLFDSTGVDLQGDVPGGIFANRKKFTSADIYLACYAFGQTFNVSPLQLITAQAACINGGYLYQPYVVEKELDGEGNIVSQHDATPIRQVISEETSATVREMLEYVVAEGTGRNGQVTGYRIGGKTGTADKTGTKDPVTNPKGDIIVSFLCFAPADDPQVIMLLTLDTPRRDTGTYPSGGNMVAPTAASIMADVLPYLGIAPQYTEENQDAAEGTVPYLVGMTKDEAAAKLVEYGFESYRVVGDGETVTDQTPAGGAIVPTGAEIILYMGAEKSTEPCKVPNVVGLSAADANKKLVNAGLIMRATGATGSGVKAMSQSHEPDAEVAPGTVITVQMGRMSSTAD